jgi:hypothetical protein
MPPSLPPEQERNPETTSPPEYVERRNADWYFLPVFVAALLIGGIIFWFTDAPWMADPIVLVGAWLMILVLPRAQDYRATFKRGHGLSRLLGWLVVYFAGGFTGVMIYSAFRGPTPAHELGGPELLFLAAEFLWTIFAFIVVRKLDRRRNGRR